MIQCIGTEASQICVSTGFRITDQNVTPNIQADQQLLFPDKYLLSASSITALFEDWCLFRDLSFFLRGTLSSNLLLMYMSCGAALFLVFNHQFNLRIINVKKTVVSFTPTNLCINNLFINSSFYIRYHISFN